MKNKLLSTRILACILVTIACIGGYLAVGFVLLKSHDLVAWLGIGEGFIIAGLIGNIIIWRRGDRKGD